MASHKRVDSAAGIVVTANATDHDFSAQIKPVQAFLDSARILTSQEGSSILQALMSKVAELETSLKASEDSLQSCTHFNKKLHADIDKLDAQKKANQGKISELAKEHEELQTAKAEDDKKLQQLQSGKRELEARFGNLERQLKAEKDVTAKLRDTVNETNAALLARTTEVQQLQKSEQALAKRHTKAEQDLSMVRRLTTKLEDEDQRGMIERMNALWQHVSAFVLTHFCGDLPLHIVKHDDAWNELKAAVPSIPLPSSNSISAKRMRFAAVATVIIKAMDDRLFHPTYLFGEGGGVREALLHQAEHDLQQERFCRSVMLSVCPDVQAAVAKSRIEDAVDDVVDVLGPVLMDKDSVDALRACAEAAHGIWEATKMTRSLYHLSFQPLEEGDPESVSIDLSVIDDGKVEDPAVVRGLNDDVVAVVFPRVYIAGKPSKQLSAGKALRRYQTSMATHELEKEEFRRPKLGSGTSRPKPQPGRVRRRSVALAEHNGVHPQSLGKGPAR